MASIHTETHKSGRRSYRVKWRVPDPTKASGWRQESRSFDKRSDAQLCRAQVEAGVELEPAARIEPAVVTTVSDVLARYVKTRRAARGTLAKERSAAKRIESALGSCDVATLRTSDGRAWLADMVDEGRAAETVAAYLRYLRSVLDLAVEDGDAAANVAARVKPPRIVRPPLDAEDVLTVAEFEAILGELPERWRASFALRAYAGPRLSEAFGMRAEDVDLLHKRLHVGHRVLEEVDGVLVLREYGKTGRGSDRWVPIPDRVVELLEAHLAKYAPGRDGLIFATATGEYPRRDNLRVRVWHPAVEMARLPGEHAKGCEDDDCQGCRPVTRVTMRNLRHTAASWMLAAGLDPVEVAYRMGHAKPSMTLDVYARFLPRPEGVEDPYADVFRRNIGGTSGA